VNRSAWYRLLRHQAGGVGSIHLISTIPLERTPMRRYLLMFFVGFACLAMIESARAQAPVPGQPYQVPDGYTGYGSGTLISYGGYNYVIQGDGTMLLAADPGGASQDANQLIEGQPYQVPVEFASSDAGSVISYGGADYVAQGDGTMLMMQPSNFGGGASAGDSGPPMDGTPGGFTYGSNYVVPGGGGYTGDDGGGSDSSTSLSLGIGIGGNPRWNRNPRATIPGQPNPSGSQGRPGGGLVHRPGGPVHRPGGPVHYPGGPVHRPGGPVHYPGGPVHYPGGPVHHPGGQVYHPGGQVRHPGGQVYHPGGQVRHAGGQTGYARGGGFRPSGGGGFRPSGGGGFRPSGGGFAGARPMRRR
jgi:hypothetical protein